MGKLLFQMVFMTFLAIFTISACLGDIYQIVAWRHLLLAVFDLYVLIAKDEWIILHGVVLGLLLGLLNTTPKDQITDNMIYIFIICIVTTIYLADPSIRQLARKNTLNLKVAYLLGLTQLLSTAFFTIRILDPLLKE